MITGRLGDDCCVPLDRVEWATDDDMRLSPELMMTGRLGDDCCVPLDRVEWATDDDMRLSPELIITGRLGDDCCVPLDRVEWGTDDDMRLSPELMITGRLGDDCCVPLDRVEWATDDDMRLSPELMITGRLDSVILCLKHRKLFETAIALIFLRSSNQSLQVSSTRKQYSYLQDSFRIHLLGFRCRLKFFRKNNGFCDFSHGFSQIHTLSLNELKRLRF